MAAEEVVAAAEVVEDEEVTGKEVQVVLTAWAATGQESLTREDLVAEEAGITMVEWVVPGVINPSQLSASLQQSVELSSAEVCRLIITTLVVQYCFLVVTCLIIIVNLCFKLYFYSFISKLGLFNCVCFSFWCFVHFKILHPIIQNLYAILLVCVIFYALESIHLHTIITFLSIVDCLPQVLRIGFGPSLVTIHHIVSLGSFLVFYDLFLLYISA